MRIPRILVISSPSGGGKTTVAQILKNFGFSHITTATTRAKRPNEREGVDYHFVDLETFKSWIKEEKLLEWTEIYGNYYGVPKENLYGELEKGRNVVLTLDLKGKRALENIFKGDNRYKFASVFLLPPSIEELKKRLRERGEEDIKKRLDKVWEEIESSKEYDFSIVNDDIDKVVRFILCKVI
jgi:guanylate kinase